LGTGIHNLFDTTGIYHSHNVWLYTAVVYGVPLASGFALLYLAKIREVRKTLKMRRSLIKIGRKVPDTDDIIIYSTVLVFMVLLFESFVENTFFYIPRVSLFLYALLGMSKAASENISSGSSHGTIRASTSKEEESIIKTGHRLADGRRLGSATKSVAQCG
jgi:O-antigen ligase